MISALKLKRCTLLVNLLDEPLNQSNKSFAILLPLKRQHHPIGCRSEHSGVHLVSLMYRDCEVVLLIQMECLRESIISGSVQKQNGNNCMYGQIFNVRKINDELVCTYSWSLSSALEQLHIQCRLYVDLYHFATHTWDQHQWRLEFAFLSNYMRWV
jgi:hypothetical protein